LNGIRRRRWIGALLVAALVLVGLRVMLATIARDELNTKLDRMGSYHGSVESVDLHLLRGAYSIHHLSIVKNTGKVPVPFLTVDVLDIAVSWSGLLHGGIVGRAEFDRPVLNFVDADDSAKAQSGKGSDWRAQLESIIPIRLDEVVIRNGTATFRNFESSPPVDLKATKIDAIIHNLSNVQSKGGQRVADFTASAQLFDQAPMSAKAKFDPIGNARTFDVEFRVDNIDLPRANDLIRAYAHLDLAQGTGDFAMELHAQNGQVTGYAKPLLHNLKIFSWKKDIETGQKNPLQLGYEALADLVSKLFTNESQDQLGTRIPISGSVGDTSMGAIPAVLGILRNAFIEAYRPGFDELSKKAPPSPTGPSKN